MTLHAHDLCCVRGERRLFKGLSLSLAAGQALRVRGANGSGKTTLLRTLAGLAQAESGEVRWQGRAIAACRDEYHSRMIYLGHAAAVKDELLAWENLVYAARLNGRLLARADAERSLAALGLGRAAQLPARALSQGQRKRLALARLHGAEGEAAPLWILDEPFNALDQDAVAVLCGALDQHFARGGMLVYTTHTDLPLHPAQALELNLDRATAPAAERADASPHADAGPKAPPC
jgi:heme exporter protein A